MFGETALSRDRSRGLLLHVVDIKYVPIFLPRCQLCGE